MELLYGLMPLCDIFISAPAMVNKVIEPFSCYYTICSLQHCHTFLLLFLYLIAAKTNKARFKAKNNKRK